MQTFSKYVTDLLVRTSDFETFEPSKSWKKSVSNHQKNLTNNSSLQASLNDECDARSRIVFPTVNPILKVFASTSFYQWCQDPDIQATSLCVFGMNSFIPKNSWIKGGPEFLEKESHEILGSKRDDRFSNPFFEMVPKTCQGSFFVPALA